MKKGFLFIALIVIGFLSEAFQTADMCDASALKSVLKKELTSGYRYDASKIVRFTYSSKFQGKEIEVPLFSGEQYRFVFNLNGVDKNFQIYISNEKSGNKDRKNIFALRDVRQEGENIYVFEPKKSSNKVYITYIIPPSVKSTGSTCVAFMLGYKINSF